MRFSVLVVSLCIVAGFVAVSALSSSCGAVSRDPTTPAVGAIRWDAWFLDNDYEKNLAAAKWRSRLPFYAQLLPDGRITLRSDRQDVMEKEIAYARDAGLDYWAFCYYDVKAGAPLDRYNHGLRRYLSTRNKMGLRFCLIIEANHLGPKEEWRRTVQKLVTFFQEPSYQKVSGDRPLLFIFDPPALTKWSGSDQVIRAAFEELDRAAVAAGLERPFVVAQGTSAASTAILADRFGFDAIGAYTLPEKGPDVERGFGDLARANRRFWAECKATEKQTIPIVNVGWDNRPRRSSPETAAKLRGPWYTAPASGELAAHLASAIEWVRKNPDSTRANAIIIYAWNESDEGGWLVPTLQEGTGRLKEVKVALQMRQRSISSPTPGRMPSGGAR